MLLANFIDFIRQMNLDAYITPIANDHFSEIIGSCDDRVKALTGFTGTYGIAVTGKINMFFTTFQFTEKARNEVKNYQIIEEDGNGFHTQLSGKGLQRVGISAKLITSKEFIKIRDQLSALGITLVAYSNDLLDKVWKEQPRKVFNDIFNLESHKYSEYVDYNYIKLFPEMKISESKGYNLDTIIPGVSYLDKIADLQEELGVREGILISNLSTIGWLTNLRGSDLAYSSEFYAFAYLTKDTLKIFSGKKIEMPGIDSYPYNDFYDFLNEIANDKVHISGDVNYFIYSKLMNPTYTEKVELAEERKNSIETFGMKMAALKDAQALIKLFVWINNTTEPTELEIQKKMIALKKKNRGYFSESFAPIIASGINSREIYHAPSDKRHKKDDLLLVDVGSHYMHGTTDITRTVCFGVPTDDMIRFYTITLKSLVNAKYIRKTSIRGSELDDAARLYFKKINKDYPTATGHGIGFFSSVHEKVPKMSYENDTLALYNIFTLEPSYFDAAMGIRIEDMVLLNSQDEFIFQTNLSYVPLQLNLIDNSMLTENERKMINLYSRKMREFLTPLFKKGSEEMRYVITNTEKLPDIEQTKDVDGDLFTQK
jgi:Xaa-Pro aminopeptidase